MPPGVPRCRRCTSEEAFDLAKALKQPSVKEVDELTNPRDTGKRRLDLIPVSAINAMGDGFTYGTSVYPENGYLEDATPDMLYAKILRHLMEWRAGRKIDDGEHGSGLPHLSCAITNAAMLIAVEEKGANG